MCDLEGIFTLSGREASILALLAQSCNLPDKDKTRILALLDGSALKIAKVIVGETSPVEKVRIAAEGFTSWAKTLRKG
jgi:hypothetical protein